MKEKTLLEKALATKCHRRMSLPADADLQFLAIAHIQGEITLMQVCAALGRQRNYASSAYLAVVRGLRAAYQNGRLKIVNGKP